MPTRLRKGLLVLATRLMVCVLLGVAATPAARPAEPGIRFADFHGAVLRAVQLHVVYWGTDWTGTLAYTAGRVAADMQTMLASAFMGGLHQYRGIGAGTVKDATTVTDPDAPVHFDDDDIADFLDAQFNAGTLARPDASNQDLYVVMIPDRTGSGEREYGGEHDFYERSGQRVHFAWITHQSTLAATTALISHEVVEAATDPEGSAVLGVRGTCGHRPGWCEISDVCSRTGVVDGVAVQSYWSNAAEACVLADVPAGALRVRRVHQGDGDVHLVVDAALIRTVRRREP